MELFAGLMIFRNAESSTIFFCLLYIILEVISKTSDELRFKLNFIKTFRKYN